MNTVHRTRPGHWANQHEMPAAPEVDDEPAPARFPFWPFALCFGFPFLLALVVWLVRALLKGTP